MRKKLLWISHFLPYPLDNGAKIRSFNLIKELSKHFDLSLFIIDCKSDSPIQKDVLQQFSTKLSVDLKNISYNSRSINIFKKIFFVLVSVLTKQPAELKLFHSESIEKNLRSLLKENFEFYHFDSIDLYKYFHLTDPTKSFLTHHNVESRLLLSMSNHRIPKFFFLSQSYFMENLEKLSCPNFKCNFMVSELDTKEIKSFTKGTFAVIPNGVDTVNISMNNNANSSIRTIGWLGGLDWKPNLDGIHWFLKNIWPALKENFHDMQFILAGKETEKLVNYYADDKISSLGYLNNVSDFYSQVDLLVVPLLSGGGTRLKILDALARGLPTISTTKGAEGIDYVDNVNLMIANSPDEFCNKINSLKAQKELYLKLKKNGRDLVEEKYSWEGIGRKMASVILGNA